MSRVVSRGHIAIERSNNNETIPARIDDIREWTCQQRAMKDQTSRECSFGDLIGSQQMSCAQGLSISRWGPGPSVAQWSLSNGACVLSTFKQDGRVFLFRSFVLLPRNSCYSVNYKQMWYLRKVFWAFIFLPTTFKNWMHFTITKASSETLAPQWTWWRSWTWWSWRCWSCPPVGFFSLWNRR